MAQIEKEKNTEMFEAIENLEEEDEAERQRILRRRQRIEEMKRQKLRTVRLHRCVLASAAVLLLAAGIGAGVLIRAHIAEAAQVNQSTVQQDQEAGEMSGFQECVEDIQSFFRDNSFRHMWNSIDEAAHETDGESDRHESDADGGEEGNPEDGSLAEEPAPAAYAASTTAATAGFGEEIVSEYGVIIDVESQTILAEKDYQSRMYPASMTKILTVLTAAEVLGIADGTEAVLDDTFTMTIEITDYCYIHDCSVAYFSVGEEIPVRDLFYGTVLPSGADAAIGLAIYTAGSHEAFVELMNEKLKAMGLSDTTHFTNCIGLYDEEHYSTVYDIAVILKEAADIPFCREVLSAHTYNTALTEQHPEGMLLSNWFLRRIEDKDTHGEVLCAKTGYVNQSGSCAASLAVDVNGREYLCVTAKSRGTWQCINDQKMLYQMYLPEV